MAWSQILPAPPNAGRIAALAGAALVAASAALIVRFTVTAPDAKLLPGAISTLAGEKTPSAGAFDPIDGQRAISAQRAAATMFGGTALAEQRPTFDIVRIEPTGDAVIAGHASANSAVELWVDGRVVAKADADRLGDFAMSPPSLPAGAHHLELAARSDSTSAVFSEDVQIEVPASVGSTSSAFAPSLEGVSTAAKTTLSSPNSPAARTSEIISPPDAAIGPNLVAVGTAQAPNHSSIARARVRAFLRLAEAVNARRGTHPLEYPATPERSERPTHGAGGHPAK
jgi:hypothetical protein